MRLPSVLAMSALLTRLVVSQITLCRTHRSHCPGGPEQRTFYNRFEYLFMAAVAGYPLGLGCLCWERLHGCCIHICKWVIELHKGWELSHGFSVETDGHVREVAQILHSETEKSEILCMLYSRTLVLHH
ncbi:hypothetical protein EDD86DRAFT_46514 [Gorgonomyces haynaldii]|nr:hypothetical protein EDD86DRAFT_46514 [Gorgonomyces haynaldii]